LPNTMAAPRSVIDLDDELGRIWALVGELSGEFGSGDRLFSEPEWIWLTMRRTAQREQGFGGSAQVSVG
jgi:hypothetical protein